MNKMLDLRSPDGIMQVSYLLERPSRSSVTNSTHQTFFTDFKNRVDPVVCCNVLSLFFQYGRGDELAETLCWVRKVLERRAYIHGTSYYPVPETFLFFLSRLMLRLEKCLPQLHSEMTELIIERLKERIGIQVDAANLAMRLIACQQFGVCDVQGLRELMTVQEVDGGWEMGTLYQYSNKKLCLGNRGTSTALAIDAVRRCQSWLSLEQLS
jgi:hypothetical protein